MLGIGLKKKVWMNEANGGIIRSYFHIFLTTTIG